MNESRRQHAQVDPVQTTEMETELEVTDVFRTETSRWKQGQAQRKRKTQRKPSFYMRIYKGSSNSQLALEADTEEEEVGKQSRFLTFCTKLCCGPDVAWGPDDPFIQNWQAFIVILLFYTTFVTTYEVAFLKDEQSLKIDGLFFVNRFVDLGFLADMLVNFNMAYLDEKSLVANSRKKVRRHYLRGWFILDGLSLLPFGLIGELASSAKMKDMAGMRLLRMLRLVKLARLMRGFRIITPIMMASDLFMRQWAFIFAFSMLVIFFHWSVCALMILTDLENAEPNWQTAVNIAQIPQVFDDDDDDGVRLLSAGDITRLLQSGEEHYSRYLKGGGKGGGDDTVDLIPATGWYLEASKFTLAVFGVWSFDPPPIITAVEIWYTIVMTIFAASFYTYLAGLIVELVSRMGEVSRALNGKYDGIMLYLDAIGFPMAQRKVYKKFYWNCKPYLLHQYYLESLPQLSPKLEGRLALFHYGEHLRSVPFFSCEGDDELLVRFQALVAAQLTMRAFIQNEKMLVDCLHLVCEGLIGCNGRVKRKGTSIGHQQVLNGRAEPSSACSLTFAVCMVLQSEDLWDILRTGQFGIIKRKVKIQHGILALKMLLQRMVVANRNASPSGWRKEEMQKYKEFLLRCCRGIIPPNKAAALTPEDELDSDFAANVERHTRAIAGADVTAIRDQRTMLRMIMTKIEKLSAPCSSPDVPKTTDTMLRMIMTKLEKLSAPWSSPHVPNTTDTIPPIPSSALPSDGEGDNGCNLGTQFFDGVIVSPAAATAPPPPPLPPPPQAVAAAAAKMDQLLKQLDGLCADVCATKTEVIATKTKVVDMEDSLQSVCAASAWCMQHLGRIEDSLEAVCAAAPPASNLSMMVGSTESGAKTQKMSGTGPMSPRKSPGRIGRKVPNGPPLDLDFEKAPTTAGVEARLARIEETLLQICTAIQGECLPVVDCRAADV
jgi:hypothetical protein